MPPLWAFLRVPPKLPGSMGQTKAGVGFRRSCQCLMISRVPLTLREDELFKSSPLLFFAPPNQTYILTGGAAFVSKCVLLLSQGSPSRQQHHHPHVPGRTPGHHPSQPPLLCHSGLQHHRVLLVLPKCALLSPPTLHCGHLRSGDQAAAPLAWVRAVLPNCSSRFLSTLPPPPPCSLL